ncbi:MAG: hypothetical protein R2725_00410 [Solirubrobacterales bacterium]
MAGLLQTEECRESRVEAGERLARAELRRQIGRLESELAGLRGEAFGRVELEVASAAAVAGPRLLGLGELERQRDALADRAAAAREALAARSRAEADSLGLLGRMREAPGDYRWVQISRAEVGEPGCGHWHSRPRFGPIGMLMGWWRVKVSSGCPLAGRLAAVGSGKARRVGSPDQRPPAPWGSAPLAELVILAGIVSLVVGIVGGHPTAIGLGVALAGLGGLEVAIREHFAGYRSHTSLLAGFVFVVTVGLVYYVGDQILLVGLGAGAVAFAIAYYLLRRAFQRASGGYGFRIGGMRG